jgi:hypothetical protein
VQSKALFFFFFFLILLPVSIAHNEGILFSEYVVSILLIIIIAIAFVSGEIAFKKKNWWLFGTCVSVCIWAFLAYFQIDVVKDFLILTASIGMLGVARKL